jgi:hypothetical protein
MTRGRMLSPRLVSAGLVSWLALAGCGGSSSEGDSTGDAGPSKDAGFGHVSHRDAAVLVDAGNDLPDVTKTPLNRMAGHDKLILSSMRLQAVYFGDTSDGAQSFDAMMTWLLSSNYWKIMSQYGVNAGSLVGSVRLNANDVFLPGVTPTKVISAEDLAARVYALLHPATIAPSDAGADGDANGGPVGPATPLIPIADAYIFFLPNGVNVGSQDSAGMHQTCIDNGGYHTDDGQDRYAVIPPCAFGRSAQASSHELAEMATDPSPGRGWFSDKDQSNAGGEIGDLCNQPVTVEGWAVTELWSNKDGDCEPSP